MISNTATAEIIMLGIKVMPPNRGMGALCTFLRVGISYNFFFLQNFRTVGMKNIPHAMLSMNAPMIDKISVNIFTTSFYYIN